jgi:hypothetical protein
VGKQIGVQIPAWRSGGWTVESADGAERIRYCLEVTRRGEALGAFLRTGRAPDGTDPGLLVTCLDGGGQFETLLDRAGLSPAQVANAKATGQLWRQGAVVLSGGVTPDWFVHGQGATTLWSRSNEVPSWFVSGYTDYLSERILGTMITKFVTVERSAGLSEGVEKQGSESWRLWLRNMALLGDDPKCGILFSSSLTGLTLKDVMKSWSIVEYLYRRDAKAFMDFATRILEGPTDRALRAAYELTPDTLDEAWREWIVEVG